MTRHSFLLLVLLALVLSAAPAVAHEPAFGPFDLAGEYDVDVAVEEVGANTFVFAYTVTNLTEAGYYDDIGGMPAWCGGIDPTGLDGFFVLIPESATVLEAIPPDSYRPGGWWSYLGRWDSIYPGFDWVGFWGNMEQSVYPIGVPLTFSLRIDNVRVGMTTLGLETYFYDHAVRGWLTETHYTMYFTQGIGPVSVVSAVFKYLVDATADLNLEGGVAASLNATLAGAGAVLEDGNDSNDVAAVGKLRAFIRQVDAQAGKKIPQADADALMAAAQEIIDLITG